MANREVCDFVARPEAGNRAELSSVTWENVYRYLIKGVSIVGRSALGCSVASGPEPRILSRSHPSYVIVAVESVVVTRVRADKPCNVVAYRTPAELYPFTPKTNRPRLFLTFNVPRASRIPLCQISRLIFEALEFSRTGRYKSKWMLTFW